MSFRVMARQCGTCIYRPDSPLDLEKLEAEVRDERGFLTGWRICHSSGRRDACCRGFWNRHKDGFAVGQIAQRLGAVEYADPEEDH